MIRIEPKKPAFLILNILFILSNIQISDFGLCICERVAATAM